MHTASSPPSGLEPVFVGFVQDAPGSTGPAWWSMPAEVGFPLLPFFPLHPGSVSKPSVELDPKQVSGCFRVLLISVFYSFVYGSEDRAGGRTRGLGSQQRATKESECF